MRYGKILGVSLLVLPAVILLNSPVASKVYKYPFNRTISIEKNLNLTIKNNSGSVTISTNQNNELTIEAIKRIEAPSKVEADLIAAHLDISVSATAGHFVISPDFQNQDMGIDKPDGWPDVADNGNARQMDFNITVPVDCRVDVMNENGPVIISGIRGDAGVENVMGDIQLSAIKGDLEINGSGGELKLNDIEGQIKVTADRCNIEFKTLIGNLGIKNGDGKIKGDYLSGDLSLEKAAGDADLEDIEGNVLIGSQSGKIDLVHRFGNLNILNTYGDVDITTNIEPQNMYEVETKKGSIKLNIPEFSNGRIRMKSGKGKLDAQVPLAVETFSETEIFGTFGSGGPNITLTTGSGDIVFSEF